MRRSSHLFRGAACALVATLTACGGGGGGSSPALIAATVAPVPRGSTPPSPSPSSSASPAASPTARGATPSPVATATATATARGASPTPTAGPTQSPTPLLTPTPTPRPTPTPTPGPSIAPVAAAAADAFVDMIGVVTHFAYSDTVYRYLTPANPAPNGDSVVSSLMTLGVRHLRDGDGQMGTNPALCSAFGLTAAAGIDADIVSLPTDSAVNLSAIPACVGAGLRAVEGPNELDLAGDANYAAHAVAQMATIAGARGTAFPAGVALFAPSFANTCTSYQAEANVNNDAVAALFDYNNAHIYFSGNQPETSGYGSASCAAGPFGSERTDVLEAKIPAPAKPFVITETGYPDNCCGFNDGGFVAPSIKSKYLLRELLIHFLAGARYAYIYELASESQSYGLTDAALNPKPAYTALENFIRILKDPGGSATAAALRYAASPSLAGVARVLFAKRDGSFWLVLWQPTQSWNPSALAPIAVAPVTGTLTFTAPPASLSLYTIDPATGTTTAAPIAPASTITLSVSDMPEILQIGTTSTPPILATPQPPVY